MQVKFTAQIKQINTKQCVSGDSTTRIVLEQDNLSPSIKSNIDAVMASGLNGARELTVTIEE